MKTIVLVSVAAVGLMLAAIPASAASRTAFGGHPGLPPGPTG